MKEEYGSFAGMIDAGWNYVCTATKNYVVDLGSKAEVKVKEVWSDTKALAKDAYDVAVQGFTSVAAKAQEAKQWWKDNVSEPFKSTVKENFIEPIREMKESAKAFVNEAKYELTNTFDNLKESISNGFNTAMEWCCEHSEIFSGMYDSIKGMTLAGMGAAMMEFGGAALSTGFWPVMIAGGVSLIAGAGCLCFGAADTGEGIIEIINGAWGLNLPDYNVMKDALFGGNQISYDSAEISFVFAGYMGAAIAQWLMPSSSGGQNIAKNAGYDNSKGTGTIRYGELDSLGRATGADATITADMIGTGSPAKSSIKPAGFAGQKAGHARGHLLGNQLGGAGDDPRNLTTLFQNPVNHPIMSSIEASVRKAVESGEIVQYSVKPFYEGNNLISSGITIKATGNNGFYINQTILNRK